MLAPDLRFEGYTQTDWTRLLSLFRPRRVTTEERDPDRPRGGIIAVSSGPRLWKLTHTIAGRLRLDEAKSQWPMSAEALAKRHLASWALCIEAGALEAIMERFGARARRGEGLDEQLLGLLLLAREELVAGRLELWPFRLRGVPVPSAAVVRASVDSVCPVGKALLLGLFEGGELWTSIALRRGPHGFDLVLGPDELRADMGLLSGDWRRDYRHLARAVEDRAAPIAVGCYAEVATLRRLVVDPSPGAWARAAAIRDLILAPLPATVGAALGLDAGRAAYAAVHKMAERFDPLGIVAPSFEAMRQVAASVFGHVPLAPTADEGDAPASGLHTAAAESHSFRPLELLRRVLTRER